MPKYEQVWKSLEEVEYRREYSADVGTGLAFQIKLLREKHGWTQQQLAERTGKQQGTISQWENPDYGRYTINTLKSLASAFDVALLVRFAPFSELVNWSVNLTPQQLAPPSFNEEQAKPLNAAVASSAMVVTTASFANVAIPTGVPLTITSPPEGSDLSKWLMPSTPVQPRRKEFAQAA